MREWLDRKSLVVKVVSGVAIATIVSMAGLIMYVERTNRNAALDSIEREMTSLVEAYQQSLELVYANATERAKSMMPAYMNALGGELRLGTQKVMTGEAGLVRAVMNEQGKILSGDVTVQETIRRLTGADTAIIVRNGNDWIRASTLLSDGKGGYRIGSKVPPDDHLARTLDAGVSSDGLVERNGRWYAMSVHPLKDDSGRVFGGLSVRVDVHDDVRRLLDDMATRRVAEHGSIGILKKTDDGWHYMAGPREGKKATQEVDALFSRHDDGKGRGFVSEDLGGDRGVNMVAWSGVPHWDWTIYASGLEADFMREANRRGLIVMGVMFAGTLLIVLVAGFIAQRAIAPVRGVVQHMARIEGGDLSVEPMKVPEKTRNEVHHLIRSMNAMQEGLAAMVRTVHDVTNQIRIGTGDIVAGNVDLSARTEQQAASLEQTAASMTEISSTVRQTADNANEARELAYDASRKAAQGGAVVTEVVQTMGAISASSSRVTEIVGVIDSIAFQTNILALNAAVEAARAGAHGRGFSVVASEVRTLAQRSASAAREIKDLIEDARSQVETGVRQVEKARDVIGDLVTSVEKVTSIMGEISVATNEQSDGISQVNQAIGQMDMVTQQNASLVEQAAAAAARLNDQMKVLVDIVTRFRLENSSPRQGTAATPQLPLG